MNKIVFSVLISLLSMSCIDERKEREENTQNDTISVSTINIEQIEPECALLKSKGAKKLTGEDGSTWFLITKEGDSDDNLYRIQAYYSYNCNLRWNGVFQLTGKNKFDLLKDYEFVPLCTYESCSIKQESNILKFVFKKTLNN